jgi:hypothetical protein
MGQVTSTMRIAAALVASVLAAVLGITATGGPAVAGPPAPRTASVSPCNGWYCLGPSVTVLESNTTACQGSTQYFGGTDHNGVGVNWTYSNGGHACVNVSYRPAYTSLSCSFWIYVPNEYATATVYFGYWSNGVKRIVSLNEATVDGWVYLFNAPYVSKIDFQDNNGQTGTRIGWGSSATYGIAQYC